MPKVSVVMPVYNREAMVGRAIRSILEQDFQDFEFLIVDDGSSDRTVEAIRAFSDGRIRLVNLPGNCGAWMARNMGLSLARGEFIATMDSDDVSFPGRLGKQVEYLQSHAEVDFLGTKAVMVEGENRAPVRHSHDEGVIKARLLALNGSSMFHPTTMIRSAFLQQTGLRYLQEPVDDDHRFWIEAMASGARFAMIEEHLLEYHRHADNLTASGNPANRGYFQRKTPMRARVLGLFFPGLTHEEAMAIALSMEEGRKPSIMDMCLALAAMRKAGTDARSYLGESKAEVGRILGEHARRAIRVLSQQGQPA